MGRPCLSLFDYSFRRVLPSQFAKATSKAGVRPHLAVDAGHGDAAADFGPRCRHDHWLDRLSAPRPPPPRWSPQSRKSLFPRNRFTNATNSCAGCTSPSDVCSQSSVSFHDIPARTSRAIAVYQGFENFEQAEQSKKGVLLLTGHVGGWEIGSFVHSLYGHPMNIVVRPLDNPYINRLAEEFRSRFGNRLLPKQDFARGLLAAMHNGETVGILMDTNMTPPQGDFVPFFGVLACTATGLARVALKTGAAVVPAFTIWDDQLLKYRVQFEPAIKLVQDRRPRRRRPRQHRTLQQRPRRRDSQSSEQWLWVHRRWKTRPPGEPRSTDWPFRSSRLLLPGRLGIYKQHVRHVAGTRRRHHARLVGDPHDKVSQSPTFRCFQHAICFLREREIPRGSVGESRRQPWSPESSPTSAERRQAAADRPPATACFCVGCACQLRSGGKPGGFVHPTAIVPPLPSSAKDVLLGAFVVIGDHSDDRRPGLHWRG